MHPLPVTIQPVTLGHPRAGEWLRAVGELSARSAMATLGFTDIAITGDGLRRSLENDTSAHHQVLVALAGDQIGADQIGANQIGADQISGDNIVGDAWLSLPHSDNTHLLHCFITVDPAHLRRGVGTALAERVLAIARGAGRRVVTSWSDHGVGRDEGGAPEISGDDPSTRFARSLGFECQQVEERHILRLTPGVRARLAEHDVRAGAQDFGETRPGYDILTWHGRAPEGHVESLARLLEQMSVDIPMGGLDMEQQVWSAERIRAEENSIAAGGWTSIMTVARDRRSGALVGYTELHAKDDFATQEDTFVRGAHRGHGLGLAMKRANLAELVSLFPRLARVHTWNATDNSHMLAINRELGFALDGLSAAWQLQVEPAHAAS